MCSDEKIKMIPLLLCKQLAGTLTDEERAVLDDWRRECPANEEVFRRLNNPRRLDVEHRIDRISDYQRPLADMQSRLDLQGKTGKTRRIRPFLRWVAAAAVVILLADVGLMLWKRHALNHPAEQAIARALIAPGHTQAVLTLADGETVSLGDDPQKNDEAIARATERQQADSPGTDASREVAFNNLTTPRGGEFKVTLEDGTEVWLNADSRLHYPEVFGDAERRVELTGEAYFKVARDDERPFYVVSGGQEIRVYGTEFNINAYTDQQEIYTTLVAGSISLRPVDGNKSELLLTPGYQAVFDKEEATAHVQAVDTEVVTSWRSGVFVFENQTMEQIMHALSRWYDFEYEFTDRQVAQTVFMGSIPRYGSFQEVCEIFHKMGGIRLRQKGKTVIISIK